MLREHKCFILAAAAAVTLAGCVSAETPRLDAHFGDAVRAARAQQTMNPDASRNADPVSGIDAASANNAVDRYHDSFKRPPTTFEVINIGGSIAGGGAGQ